MTDQPFEFRFQDNQSYMYTDAPHCTDCSRVLDPDWISPTFEFDGPEFDVSMTSDGCLVVSDRFIAACLEIDGPEFDPIPSLPGFSVMTVVPTIRLDPFMNRIRVGVNCVTCGEPRFVVHDGPLTLSLDSELGTGLFRSEDEFGDTADFGPDHPIRLAPVIAADQETVQRLKSTDLTGIHVIAP